MQALKSTVLLILVKRRIQYFHQKNQNAFLKILEFTKSLNSILIESIAQVIDFLKAYLTKQNYSKGSMYQLGYFIRNI